MRSGRRDITLPLFGIGVVLFVIAILGGGNVVFGAADILIGAAIGMYAARGAPPQARNPQLYLLGLVIAAAAAILDGVLTLIGPSTVTSVLTWVVVAGALISMLGYGPPRR